MKYNDVLRSMRINTCTLHFWRVTFIMSRGMSKPTLAAFWLQYHSFQRIDRRFCGLVPQPLLIPKPYLWVLYMELVMPILIYEHTVKSNFTNIVLESFICFKTLNWQIKLFSSYVTCIYNHCSRKSYTVKTNIFAV